MGTEAHSVPRLVPADRLTVTLRQDTGTPELPTFVFAHNAWCCISRCCHRITCLRTDRHLPPHQCVVICKVCSGEVEEEQVEEETGPVLHASSVRQVKAESLSEEEGLELHASPKASVKASVRPKTRLARPQSKYKVARRERPVQRDVPEVRQEPVCALEEEETESEYSYYSDDESEPPAPKRAGAYGRRN